MGNLFTTTSKNFPTDECAICLAPLKDYPSKILICGHEYHKVCIKKWETKSDECPVCRERKPMGICG